MGNTGQNQGNQNMNQKPGTPTTQSQNQTQNQTNQQAQPGEDPNQVKKVQTKFQSVSLREYYDGSNMTLVLTKGLEELGRLRYKKIYFISFAN